MNTIFSGERRQPVGLATVLVLGLGSGLGSGLALDPTASAEVVIEFDGMQIYERVTRNYEATAFWNAPKRFGGELTSAGVLTFNDGEYQSFCIELKQPATVNPVAYDLVAFSDLPGRSYQRSLVLSSLFEQYYEDILVTDSDAKASAFAMMTWEIMLEGFSFIPGSMFSEISLDAGAVQFSDVSTEAAAWYREMGENLYVADSSDNILALTNPQYQDQVIWVPAPSVLALAGLWGLLGHHRRTR